MPELPEVQTIVNALKNGGRGAKSILNYTIQETYISWNKTITTQNAEKISELITNQKIIAIRRRGKHIILALEKHIIIVHLRMSGDLLVLSKEEENPKHARVTFIFKENKKLVFNNPRKFGRIWIVENENDVLGNLGIEPFDQTFTAEKLFTMLQKHKRQIKPLLMDQHFIAGLGNIYTDESLFLAKIHPRTLSNKISTQQASKLQKTIQLTLSDAIKRQGSSIDWMYQGGDFQNYFNVYQQTGNACPICHSPIKKIVVGQRSTHFCPSCQKLN